MPRTSASASPRRRWTSMRRSPGAWACRTCARSSRTWRSALNPEAYRATIDRAAGDPARGERNKDLIAEIEQELTGQADRTRHRGGRLRGGRSALFDLAQDGAQGDRLRAAVRHLRLPRHRRHGGRLLPRARRRPHDVADGARGGSRTTSRRRSRTTTARSTRPSSGPGASASNCRSAPGRCTRSPSTASPRTRSTRTRPRSNGHGGGAGSAVARFERLSPGCAARSRCWPKATIRRSSSSTPSSSCSTTRCSASRPRAA
jgi:hypothetical protein